MRLCEISECLLLQFCSMSCRDTARRVRQFQQRDIPLETFHRNVSKIKALQTANRAERSCSLRPRKAVAFLTHLLRAPKSKGAGSFAVCGQRLRGHVPSKNTSPTALSWISLTNQTTSFLSVPARCLLFRRAMFHYSKKAEASDNSSRFRFSFSITSPFDFPVP